MTQREIITDVLKNFKNITSYNIKDLTVEDGMFNENIICETLPLIREYIDKKYGIYFNDDMLYELDEMILSFL